MFSYVWHVTNLKVNKEKILKKKFSGGRKYIFIK